MNNASGNWMVLAFIIIGLMISPFSRADTPQLCTDVCIAKQSGCIEDISMINAWWAAPPEHESEAQLTTASFMDNPVAKTWKVQLCPTLENQARRTKDGAATSKCLTN